MDVAVERIVTSMIEKKKIGIIGDYDVDGTTSASLLTNFFSYYSIDTDVYIPNRLKDGYGPNIKAFNQFIDNGIDTVITVDCGSTAIQALEYAFNKDINVINYKNYADISIFIVP